MLVRIAYKEDPAQTASSEVFLQFRQATSVRNFRTFTLCLINEELEPNSNYVYIFSSVYYTLILNYSLDLSNTNVNFEN